MGECVLAGADSGGKASWQVAALHAPQRVQSLSAARCSAVRCSAVLPRQLLLTCSARRRRCSARPPRRPASQRPPARCAPPPPPPSRASAPIHTSAGRMRACTGQQKNRLMIGRSTPSCGARLHAMPCQRRPQPQPTASQPQSASVLECMQPACLEQVLRRVLRVAVQVAVHVVADPRRRLQHRVPRSVVLALRVLPLQRPARAHSPTAQRGAARQATTSRMGACMHAYVQQEGCGPRHACIVRQSAGMHRAWGNCCPQSLHR